MLYAAWRIVQLLLIVGFGISVLWLLVTAVGCLNVLNVLFAANQEELLNSFARFDLTRIKIPNGIRH